MNGCIKNGRAWKNIFNAEKYSYRFYAPGVKKPLIWGNAFGTNHFDFSLCLCTLAHVHTSHHCWSPPTRLTRFLFPLTFYLSPNLNSMVTILYTLEDFKLSSGSQAGFLCRKCCLVAAKSWSGGQTTLDQIKPIQLIWMHCFHFRWVMKHFFLWKHCV